MVNRKISIALIGPTYPFKGGIAQYTASLFEELLKKHFVEFYTFNRRYPKWLFPYGSSITRKSKSFTNGNEVRIIDWANPLTWVNTALIINVFSPDLIIFQWWMWGWSIPYLVIIKVLKFMRCKSKILFICHNVVEHEHVWWKDILRALVITKGDLFLVHDNESLEKLKKIISYKPIIKTFLPNYDFYLKVEKNCTLDNLDIILPKGAWVAMFFGLVRKYKGLEYLIRAVPEVVKSIPNFILLIVGEFWDDKTSYMQLISELKIKKHVKVVDKYINDNDVGKYFKLSKVIILPYITSTGSAVTQVAFTYNKPVIATNVGDFPEVVKDGRRGLIVPPEDVGALSLAIIRCYKNKLADEFSINIKKDKDLFKWSRLVKCIDNLI